MIKESDEVDGVLLVADGADDAVDSGDKSRTPRRGQGAVDSEEHQALLEPAEIESATAEGAEPKPADTGRVRGGVRPRMFSVAIRVVLPLVVLLAAVGTGYLKWQYGSARGAADAAQTSIQVATESAVAMLSYRPDTVEKDLTAASNRLTGPFRDDYMKLVNDVVIPGSKSKKIAAVASVPAAASESATRDHAMVLLFVNQTVFVANDPPASTASSVKVALQKVQGKWLVSGFDPI